MPLYTTDALILRTYKLGESDRIVVFLTRDRGKKRGVAKNARQSRRRFGGALEPMTAGRVQYTERERRDLVFLHFVEPRRSPMAAPLWTMNSEALGYVSYFAELIDEWAPEADPNENLFRLGSSIIDALAAGVPLEPLARYFEFWLLRLQGVYEPAPRASQDARAFLQAARSCSPFGLVDVPAPPRAMHELERAHRALIAMHLEKDLKSARVLTEMKRTEMTRS